MKIFDANMILRYLINDNIEMADYVENLIEKNEVIVLPEVIAEVVYVMTKVYKRDRSDISKGIITFLETDNIKTNCGNVIKNGLQLYDENNLDFVDCLLCAYHKEYGHEICTFDKKLNKLIKKIDSI